VEIGSESRLHRYGTVPPLIVIIFLPPSFIVLDADKISIVASVKLGF
jgi:hypothetical protein